MRADAGAHEHAHVRACASSHEWAKTPGARAWIWDEAGAKYKAKEHGNGSGDSEGGWKCGYGGGGGTEGGGVAWGVA